MSGVHPVPIVVVGLFNLRLKDKTRGRQFHGRGRRHHEAASLHDHDCRHAIGSLLCGLREHAGAPDAILCGLIPGEMDNLIRFGNFGHSSSHVLVQLQQSQLLRSPPLLLLSSTERDVRYKFPFIIRK